MSKNLKNKITQLREYWVIKRSGLFDCQYYLRNNLDVARGCIDPIKHYIRHGWREGRKPNEFFDTQWYMDTYPDIVEIDTNPLYHYIKHGIAEGRGPENLRHEDKSKCPLAAMKPSQEGVFRSCSCQFSLKYMTKTTTWLSNLPDQNAT